MRIITPKEFKEAFETASASDRPAATKPLGGRTRIPEQAQNTLALVADILRLDLYYEYYSIDAVFFNQQDTEHFPHGMVYANYFAIALEYEKQASGNTGSVVEINKLQLLNTPLKVLITFPATTAEEEGMLRVYAPMMRAADVFGDFEKLRKQLIVFKVPSGGWHFYLYNGTGFDRMT